MLKTKLFCGVLLFASLAACSESPAKPEPAQVVSDQSDDEDCSTDYVTGSRIKQHTACASTIANTPNTLGMSRGYGGVTGGK